MQCQSKESGLLLNRHGDSTKIRFGEIGAVD